MDENAEFLLGELLELPERRLEIIREVHDEIGHCSKQSTSLCTVNGKECLKMLSTTYVKSFEECQERVLGMKNLYIPHGVSQSEKVGIDVVYMPETPEGYNFIVFARDDLSGSVEGRAIKATNSKNVYLRRSYMSTRLSSARCVGSWKRKFEFDERSIGVLPHPTNSCISVSPSNQWSGRTRS